MSKVVRGVVDQFVRWYLGGVFRPRTNEADWCRHVFREHNTVADTHADWLIDNGDSGAGMQWEKRLVSAKSDEKLDMWCCPSMGQDVGVARVRKLGLCGCVTKQAHSRK